ncbi:MAG: hypothetical protein B7Y75_02040 [Azorhizobium sp. 35-67-5]|nr:MAG: hypothetical protein B7Y75_02040 [Azorhizobium sp. 35-67-5]
MTAGRGRLTFWDTLPDWADEVRMWAYAELAKRELMQTEIVAGANERMREAAAEAGITEDIPVVTRSTLNRLAMRRAAAVRKMAEARQMYEGLASQFDHNAADESSIVLGEFLKTLVLELAEEGGVGSKGANELASAYKAIIAGMKISADRRQKLEIEFQARTKAAVDKVAKARGMTAETAEAIKADILGISAGG